MDMNEELHAAGIRDAVMTISDNELYCGIWYVSLLLISIYYIHKHIITDKKYEKDCATTFQDYFVFCTLIFVYVGYMRMR